MVRRLGAQPGDRIVVTGTIGDAALGLDVLKRGAVATALADDVAAREMLVGRYRVPQPRTALAKALRDHAHAAMDVSDGLAGDLAKLCDASGVSAVIDLTSVPLSAAAAATLLARGAVDVEAIVSGGDDYEILCAIPENCSGRSQRPPVLPGWPLPRSAPLSLDSGGSYGFWIQQGREIALPRLSYSHF